MKRIICILICLSSFSLFAEPVKIDLLVGINPILAISNDIPSEINFYQPGLGGLRAHFPLTSDYNLYMAVNSTVIINSVNLGISRTFALNDHIAFDLSVSAVAGYYYFKLFETSTPDEDIFAGGELGGIISASFHENYAIAAGIDLGVAYSTKNDIAFKLMPTLGLRFKF